MSDSTTIIDTGAAVLRVLVSTYVRSQAAAVQSTLAQTPSCTLWHAGELHAAPDVHWRTLTYRNPNVLCRTSGTTDFILPDGVVAQIAAILDYRLYSTFSLAFA